MAGRKNNPINDIIDTVGAWLGGSRGAATNPQVQAAMDATRAIGKVVDTATGGFGQAVVSDAQRMAQSGSSTPSALYKTAAVNLGAGAVGAKAAQLVAKGAGRVVASRVNKATQAITPTNPDRLIYHAGSDPLVKGPFVRGYKPVDKRSGLPNIHMGTEAAAAQRQGERIGMDSEADISLFRRSAIDRYEIVNPKAVSKRKFGDYGTIIENRTVVQAFDDRSTPKNKILKYVNAVEDSGSTSYLVPKSRVESGDVVYRGSKEFANQFLEGPYTSPELNRLRDIQKQISANQSRISVAGAVSGIAVPKKKPRGGGTKKR